MHSPEETSQTSARAGTRFSTLAGIIVATTGILLMVSIGWLSSWWMVPALREPGTAPGGWLFLLWSMSTPLGGLLVVIGAGLMIRVGWPKILGAFVLGTALFLWLTTVAIPVLSSPLFGIGGGLITASFLGIVWTWAHRRSSRDRRAAFGSDIQILGYFLLLVAAWYLCGLLGAPVFLLRPELWSGGRGPAGATGLATTILLCLSFGWVLLFVGHQLSSSSRST